MVDYREILRLSSDTKNSLRSIELIVHSDHRKIIEVQEAAKTAGVSWPLDDSVTNEMLREVPLSPAGQRRADPCDSGLPTHSS